MVVATPSVLLVLKKLELTLDINQALQEELSSLDPRPRLTKPRATHLQAMLRKLLRLLLRTNTDANQALINPQQQSLRLIRKHLHRSNVVAVL